MDWLFLVYSVVMGDLLYVVLCCCYVCCLVLGFMVWWFDLTDLVFGLVVCFELIWFRGLCVIACVIYWFKVVLYLCLVVNLGF